MKKLPFKGSGVALVTPFTDEDKINFDVLEELIQMHIKCGTDAIIVCGTTGEASTLSDDEQEKVIEFSVRKANGRIPVIAGAGSNNTKNAKNKVKRAQNAGADALLCVTPFYNKANDNGIIKHYEEINNSVDIPVILYNVPQRTGMSFSINALKEISQFNNVVAIKEASSNLGYVCEIASNTDLYIYSGNDDITLPVMSLGGVGVISVGANIIPKGFLKMCSCALRNDFKSALDAQKEIYEIVKIMSCDINPIPVKNAMNYIGYGVGKTRMPLGKLEDSKMNKIIKVIDKYNIKKYL